MGDRGEMERIRKIWKERETRKGKSQVEKDDGEVMSTLLHLNLLWIPGFTSRT